MARRISRPGMLAGAAAVAALAFPAVASANVTSTVAAGALTVTGEANDGIAITCLANQVKVNGQDPNSGAAACDAITSIAVTGGDGANVIDLSGVQDRDDAVDTDYPAITSVTIDGGGDNDTITGTEHTDTMRGGDGNDRIVGDENKAAGSFDVFEGQGGDDTLVWNPGHDSDKMDGGDGTDTIEMNGGGGGEQFTVKPSATAGRVQFDRTGPTPPGPFTLDIGTSERLDFNANGGDDSLVSDPGLDALGFKLDIDGGAGNDTLDGGDGADLIERRRRRRPDHARRQPAAPGPARRRARRRRQRHDRLERRRRRRPQRGRRRRRHDRGQRRAASPSSSRSSRPRRPGGSSSTASTTPPGPFNIDIGTAERLDLNLNGGDDSVTADPGFDPALQARRRGRRRQRLDRRRRRRGPPVRRQGQRPDRGRRQPARHARRRARRRGDDTMVWNPGDDDDTNEGGAGNDTSEVNGGGGGEKFTVKPAAVGGRVLVRPHRSRAPPFNVDIGTTESLLLNAAGGDDRIMGAAGLAGLIKSTLNGDDGNDRIVGHRRRGLVWPAARAST